MIQLLFTLLSAEVGVVVVLLFKTPLRKLAILGLDRLKRGRGPVMVKTVAGTVLIVLASSVYSMAKIRSQSTEIGSLTPTDQVLMSRHLLESSLMGYSLFLALIIDRLHHYIRELRGLRKNMEAVMKQNRALEETKSGGSDELKSRDKDITNLNEQIKQLKLELEASTKEAKAAEANATALRKQSEGFLLEYDRLLEDNQNLRNQLQSIDLRLSQSDSKKNT
ncbi:B-cell receptor-associated protein 31-like [Cocos nucifera]|uniref:Endoplasmic reticulum transmembrane protein n=1 Tax=Cocos nucifera TaxID=13894 RepID=A0A8K0I328_COCNU|nr:B-cell receptor-associated protein 31-like [Cocos nucifera]